VLTSSYPFAVPEDVPAVVWSAHGGQEAGAALADVLAGHTPDGTPVEPTGRLPQTWYRGAEDLPDLLDYDIIASEATYLYFRGRPLFPFGHGLGYTRFEHRDLRLSADTVDADGRVEVRVDVVNTGDRAGEEVVQLYTRQRRSRVRQPLRRLQDFRRVRLAPGEQTTVVFTLAAAALAFHDVTRRGPVVETARHTVMAGRSCTDITATATLAVRGSALPDRVSPLTAASRDEAYGTRLTAATAMSGDAVEACAPGAWLGFTGVDLGAGPRRVRVTAAAPAGGARLELRLGDPLRGTLAATLDVPFTGGPYEHTEVTADLHAAGGVHDLFLVLGTPGVRVCAVAWDAS
jgi:beta-glucosidase